MKNDATAAGCAAILNRCWWIRYYFRPAARSRRDDQVQLLGLAVRQAFAESDDFAPLLRAIVTGLEDVPL
jgi:hypothetical protein